MTLAGNIEDTATMSGLTLDNNQLIVEGVYSIMAFQLLHSAQAIDLRKGFTLGEVTQSLFSRYRSVVPFANQDLVTSDIIENTIFFLKN